MVAVAAVTALAASATQSNRKTLHLNISAPVGRLLTLPCFRIAFAYVYQQYWYLTDWSMHQQ